MNKWIKLCQAFNKLKSAKYMLGIRLKVYQNFPETLHGTKSKKLLICFAESTSHFFNQVLT